MTSQFKLRVHAQDQSDHRQ